MSEFHVRVVKVTGISKHPNADALSITYVDGGYPVVFKTTDFNEGDLAAYIPIDSVVPDTEQWKFLGNSRRIKAKKLRGIFSMGMLCKLPEGYFNEGDNIQELMKIEKYEQNISKGYKLNTESYPNQAFMPEYTDIEGFRKYKYLIKEGEEVVLTEKIHGTNARFVYHDGQLWVGSHHQIKKFDKDNLWWNVALKYDLEEKLKQYPDIIIYGEVYGNVQDLKYGLPNDVALTLFDARDANTLRYFDYDEFLQFAKKIEINIVPELYRGPWYDNLKELAEGKSTIEYSNNVREGFVVRPIMERSEYTGRVILKYVGEGYLLRKEA